MQIIRSIHAMQCLAQTWRREGIPVGFVPTMGYLHEGHLSLVRRARKIVEPRGRVVVSIYVNPTQFGPHEDLSKYPRDLARDKKLCRSAGVDALLVPSDEEMYPRRGDDCFSTYVAEGDLSNVMEGKSRPTHFRGVTTIVAKLFNIVLPNIAVFGAKDFQQAVVIRRMVRDLNFSVRIVVVPTFREPDGLAMSSRNKYLTGDLRAQAVCLWQAIQKAKHLVRSTRGVVHAAPLKRQLKSFIQTHPAARVEYIEFFDPMTLNPLAKVRRGTQIALVVFLGNTRVIDNARL